MRFRIGVALSLALCLALGLGAASAKQKDVSPEVALQPADLMAGLDSSRNPDNWMLAKGASLLARADALIAEGASVQAIGILNQVVRMELPPSYPATKLRMESYLALGGIYADMARPTVKAATYYDLAIQHMDVDADAPLVAATLRTVAGIFAAEGQPEEAARLTSLARDVELGTAPAELEILAGQDIVLEAGVDGPGDDSCDVAADCSLPYSEIMSIFPSGDKNWRMFTIADTIGVRIETISDDIFGDDTNLTLYGDCAAGVPGGFIEFDEDDGPGFLSLIERVLDPGTYYLQVGGWLSTTPDDFELLITEFQPPAPDEYEPDDEASQATKIGFRNNGVGEGNQYGRDNSQVQTHSIFPAGDIDFVKFNLSRANYVRMETFGDDNPDTIMGFSNDGGLLLAVNDDKGGGDLGSRLDFCLPPGEWYLPIIAFSSFADFEYNVVVDVEYPCLFESEPNGSCGTGDVVEPGEVWSGFQTPAGVAENDWYSFTLEEEQFVTIETSGWDDFSVDTFLELWDGCGGALLAADDDSGPGFLSKIEILLPAGTYHVNVTVSPFSVGAVYPYSFVVTFSEPPVPESEPNDDCATANAVSLGDTVLASISPFGDQDYFLLTLPEDASVEIETAGPVGDTILSVWDDAGTVQYCCDDDGGEGLFSLVTYCLPAGTYCVRVEDFGNNSTISAYDISFRNAGTCSAGDPGFCPVVGLGCPVTP